MTGSFNSVLLENSGVGVSTYWRAWAVAFCAAVISLFASSALLATTPGLPKAPPAPLPVDEAFGVLASLDKGNITLKFDVLPGHYLYRDRFEFQQNGDAVKPASAFVQEASAEGKIKKDPTFGDVKVLEKPVTLNAGHTARANTQLTIVYQGCSEIAGVCYPPTRRTFNLAQGKRDVAANEVEKPGLSKLFKKQISSQ
jgi:thiol:disulfide interchange protein